MPTHKDNTKKQIALRLPPALHEQAEQIAEDNGLSLQDALRMFVYEMVRSKRIPLPIQLSHEQK